MKLKHLKHTEEFDFYSLIKSTLEKIPLFERVFSTDFHHPEDYMDMDLDLHDHLVQNPSSTFVLRRRRV